MQVIKNNDASAPLFLIGNKFLLLSEGYREEELGSILGTESGLLEELA